MADQLYRSTTLGHALQDTLDELIQGGKIKPQLATQVLQQYDESIVKGLKQRAKAQITFKAKQLHSYNLCDSLCVKLKDVEFREHHEIVQVDKVQIVAFKSPKGEMKK
ncbi:transcription initiation factor IIA subunit 2-like [Drosophila subobscura]|uniref:transcription initiation factor IIA subunit 2-like n=1 Tax=Drosophila subobscura TaxID=7241 RepID=UPI00155AA662|nr:transcription initiation factor IIA subunit 2-like [Drosophila subobscura]